MTGSPTPSATAAEHLKPYVPRLVIDWLRSTPGARSQKVPGTLAFVDISGFTELTERLSRKGKVGAEEMNDLLNGCFKELLDVAYEQDAGVVKWGGDAVLLLFDGEEHAARACRAAFDMQQTIGSAGRLRTSSGLVTLRMSVGIHSGEFDFFLVGDLHRELILTGPGATKTVEMETLAEAGEVVLSASTAAAVDPDCLGEEKGSARLLRAAPEIASRGPTPIGDVSDLDLAGCVPVEIGEHLLAGGGEPEHRPMTPAFIHFTGADELLAREGPEVLADELDKLIGGVQRIAHEHRVSFFETDIAPDGGKVMLMGGAPRSTGSDEERTLRAMRGVLALDSRLPVHIGVNWGRIFVSDFGPPYRRTYSVKGDAVNLAARLMARAELGQMLATGEVLSRSRTTFDVTALEPFRAKGKAELVQAYVVGAAGARAAREAPSAPLVGRESELEALLEAVDLARMYEGRLAELVAEPGMGKSRLIEELRTRAADVRALAVQCDEYESSTPYFAVRDLLKEVVGISADHDRDACERALRETVETKAPHLVPWLPLLAVPMGFEIEDTPETALLDEKFRKERVQEVTGELVGILLLEPTLLVFEDVHWMDDASAELLGRLARTLETRPWLIIVARRDQRTGFLAPEEARPLVIELQPLAADQAAELLHATTEGMPLLPHEIEALAERAAGNPLFLNELLTAARQAGGVEALPDSVESLMMAQIDRLPPADRRVLRSAAVIGSTFAPDLLEAALGDEAPEPETWRRLGDFLIDQGDGNFRFRHALVRDAAYEGLPFKRRREVHARVGETIEASAGPQAEDEAELLSLHFFHAHRFDKAWRFSRIAGERAAAMYANVEAAAFFERALAAARHRRDIFPAERAKVLEALGDVALRLGAFDKADPAYRAARHSTTGDPIEEARLLQKEAMVPYRQERYQYAMRRLNRALRIVESTEGAEAKAQRARLFAWCAGVRQYQHRAEEAVEWCRRAIGEAEGTDAKDALAQAYLILDWAYTKLGLPDEAVYAPRAIEIYEELGDLDRLASVLINRGLLVYLAGHWGEAIELEQRAREALHKIGDRASACVAEFNMADFLFEQGRIDEAEPLFQDVLRVCRATGNVHGIGLATSALGRIAARRGQFGEARALLEEARTLHDEEGDEVEVLTDEARLAECFVLQGESDAALSLATEALRRSQHLEGVTVVVAMLQRLRGWALLQMGELEQARVALGEALETAHRREANFGIRSSDYEVALALDALVRLGSETKESTENLEAERAALEERLGLVALPEPPLSGMPAATSTL